MKISPKAYKFCLSKMKTLPKTKYTLNILTKIFKYLPKWWNFVKSGHTDSKTQLAPCVSKKLIKNVPI